MSKTETLRLSAAASSAQRLEQLSGQIEDLRQARHQSVEELAAALEPLAQAMAALVDETKSTLAEIQHKAQEQGEKFTAQMNTAAENWNRAAERAEQAGLRLQQAGQGLRWRHYALAGVTGLVTAALVSVFWLWVAPPKSPEVVLNAKGVAEQLKPAVIEALKPSRRK
jgi:chromosome segregation ATPase